MILIITTFIIDHGEKRKKKKKEHFVPLKENIYVFPNHIAIVMRHTASLFGKKLLISRGHIVH
jgi:hypothetical protein